MRRADTFWARLRGLIGTADLHGALLLSRTSSVHGIGMRYSLDVAFLDDDLHVLATTTLRPMGFARSRASGARHVLEARAGAFATWGLEAGSRLGAAP